MARKRPGSTAIMKKRSIFIAPPGSGKTTIEAKLSEAWMDKEPGPVIVISRVKQLIGQVLSELVMINKFHPDRIMFYSDPAHDMDLKEPLMVGTFSSEKGMRECIDESFLEKRNVYIGSVANAGSISLLKYCLEMGYNVKVIVDELAEIIPGHEKDKTKNTENTLDILYKLHDANLLDYIAGFDAVWKTGVWRGMDDASFWGSDVPTILHKQEEMTSEKNVLVPVELIGVEIDEDELEVGDDESRKRQIEAAAMIKVLKHQKSLVDETVQPSAKIVAFSSGSDAAKYCKAEVDRYSFGFNVMPNEFILAATSPDHRKAVQEKLASKKTEIGIVFNCQIWTKGIDIQDLSAVALGYERLPTDEILTHIIGRVTRRHPAERGMPLDQLKLKPIGRFYVPYLRSKKDGGSDYKQILKVYSTLYECGYTTVNAKILRDGSTTKDKDPKEIENPTPNAELVDIFGTVDEKDVARIQIAKAITAVKAGIIQQSKIDEHEQFKKLFYTKPVAEQYDEIFKAMPSFVGI